MRGIAETVGINKENLMINIIFNIENDSNFLEKELKWQFSLYNSKTMRKFNKLEWSNQYSKQRQKVYEVKLKYYYIEVNFQLC